MTNKSHSEWKEIKWTNSNMTFGWLCSGCLFLMPFRVGKSTLFPEDTDDYILDVLMSDKRGINLPNCEPLSKNVQWWSLEWLWKQKGNTK